MENYQAVIRMQLIKSALFLVGVIVFVKCITTFVPEAVSVSSTINGRELPIYCVETQEKKVALSFDAAWETRIHRRFWISSPGTMCTLLFS